MVMKEAELQDAVVRILQDQDLASRITNLGYFRGRKKGSRPGYREYSYRNILTDRYDSSVIWICDRFAKWEISLVGGINPTNISLDKSDRLYPDIIAYDECKNFFLFELKVGSKTEREAVTELFAYVFELRTLMPTLNNHEISLIIISDEFGVLLSHAVLQVLSFFGMKVLCLRPKNKIYLNFEIVDPLKSLGMKDYRLLDKAISVYSLSLYQHKKVSLKANENIEMILKVVDDMLLDRANRLGSNGFYFLHKNEYTENTCGPVATYFITIGLLDPFKLLDVPSLLSRKTNISSFLLDIASDHDSHLQNHFYELVSEAEQFLKKFYHVTYETPASYRQFSRAFESWQNVSAVSCNVWGEFGEFVREILYSNKTGEDFFNEELDHTNPFCLWEALEVVFSGSNGIDFDDS